MAKRLLGTKLIYKIFKNNLTWKRALEKSFKQKNNNALKVTIIVKSIHLVKIQSILEIINNTWLIMKIMIILIVMKYLLKSKITFWSFNLSHIKMKFSAYFNKRD